MIANIGSLTAAILLLTAADFISGMATFMKGKNSFSQLGKELSAFIVSAQPFIDGAKSLTGEMMEGVKALSETLLMLTAADLIDGISSWLTGGTSLSDFAEQLKPFGEVMVEFSDVVAGKIDIDAVNSAANAGKIMAEMEKSVTKTGGVVQWFTGEHDMGKFSTQLVQFGRAIVRFSDTVSVGVNEEAITAAANAGKIMAEMQKDITPSGGVVEWFTGEKDMGKFSTQLTQFGNAIVNFSSKVAGKIDEGAVTAAANAGAIIADMQKNIAPSGGVVQWFTGDKDMSAFSKQLVQFGEAIVKYSDKVTNVDATACAASGAQMVLFTTGRGTPFASPVPTVKIATNSRLAGNKGNWIDFNAGRIVTDDLPLEDAAKELFQLVLDVASGKKVKAEIAGFHDLAIFKQGVTL